nr:4Fe-4S binding protein [Candidatus Sigynarchaeota archaeon]
MPDEEHDVYRALQQHLDALPVGFPRTKSGVDIAILKKLFTPEEARLASFLAFMPEPLKRIHKKVCKEMEIGIEVLESKLDEMLRKGLLNGGEDSTTGKKLYANAFLMMGMFDYQVKTLTKELMADVDRYIAEAYIHEYKLSGTPQLRTIPIEQSVEKENPVATYEDVRHLIETRRPINVTECICRKGKRLMGKTCERNAPSETCFQFGTVAHIYKQMGIGREISKEEAHRIIDEVEKAGLVIQPGNSIKPGNICCCCGDCCLIITHAKKLQRPLEVFATNHRSSINAEACKGCGTCIKRCPMQAVYKGSNGKSTINDNLCIGCGVCVPACPEHAMHLVKRDQDVVPPADQMEMFMKIGAGKEKARTQK